MPCTPIPMEAAGSNAILGLEFHAETSKHPAIPWAAHLLRIHNRQRCRDREQGVATASLSHRRSIRCPLFSEGRLRPPLYLSPRSLCPVPVCTSHEVRRSYGEG